jgi:hypothetical protein
MLKNGLLRYLFCLVKSFNIKGVKSFNINNYLPAKDNNLPKFLYFNSKGKRPNNTIT